MTITSYEFWLLFLPVTLCMYWLLLRKSRHKLWVLCIASYTFYALADIRFVPLLVVLSLLTFWIGQWKQRQWIGILINLITLGVFKYLDFGLSNLQGLTGIMGIPVSISLLHLLLPLGISFYVFKHIGYLVDVNKNIYPPTRDFLLFTTFSAFFPQISAGPISSFQQTGEQLASLPSRLSGGQAYQGMLHISMGLAKKILIADVLSSSLQSQLFALEQTNTGVVWAWVLVSIFALQLYFDFSGYTDIVLGIGNLFGVTLPPNFNNPYLARNPREFWQRWHISLSTWFRLYLFSPLSRNLLKRWGTKQSQLAQYSANVITMGLVGFWHGAGWGYILWGLYHGMLLNVTAAGQRARVSIPPVLSRVFFLISILFGWALFLSPNLTFAQNLFENMIGLHGLGNVESLFQSSAPADILTALIALLITLSGLSEAANMPIIKKPAYLFTYGVLLVLCLLKMGVVQQFLYVQF